MAEDPSLTCNLPGISASAGFDVVRTGVGSYHVTLALSEGEYLDRRFIYNNSYFRFHPNKNTIPLI